MIANGGRGVGPDGVHASARDGHAPGTAHRAVHGRRRGAEAAAEAGAGTGAKVDAPGPIRGRGRGNRRGSEGRHGAGARARPRCCLTHTRAQSKRDRWAARRTPPRRRHGRGTDSGAGTNARSGHTRPWGTRPMGAYGRGTPRERVSRDVCEDRRAGGTHPPPEADTPSGRTRAREPTRAPGPARARSRHGRGTQRERGRRDSSEGRGAGGAHTPAGTNATRPWGGRRGGSLRAVVQWR